MYRYIRSGIYTLLFILFCGCSVLPDELKTAEQLMETAPDSALHILQRIKFEKYNSDKNKALYGLLYIKALDKNYLPLRPDSLLNFSIAYYQKHGDKERLVTCYLYKGRMCKYAYQYEKAVEYYVSALEEAHDSKDNMLLGKINSDLGEIYSIQTDFLKARQKYYAAYQNFRKSSSKTYACYALLDIGVTYCSTKQCDKAQQYFRRVYSMTNDSMVQGAALDETGRCFYKSRQLDSALIYLRKVLPYPYITYNKAKRYQYLAKAFFDCNQIDSAYFYGFNAFKYRPDIRTQRECYRVLTNSEYLRGHMREMSTYMNKYVQLGDSIRKIDTQTKGSYIETMSLTRKEATQNKNKLLYTLVLLFMVIGISVVLYMRIQRKNRRVLEQKEEQRRTQKAELRQEILLKKRESLQRKVTETKALYEAEWKKNGPAERRKIILQVYKQAIHFGNTALFYREVDPVLNNMASKLRKRYPDLGEYPIQWCCLHMLEVPKQDIMVLLDYNPESLKKMRQRLAQKVQIGLVSKIDDFLNSIFTE